LIFPKPKVTGTVKKYGYRKMKYIFKKVVKRGCCNERAKKKNIVWQRNI